MIYLIGSLRNPAIPEISNKLRKAGYDIFADWFAAGKDADDHLRDYEKSQGRNFQQALDGYVVNHIFEFDKKHIERADAVVLVLPAGKSGHLELGWALGRGKRGYILLNGEPDRIDVMYRFADAVVYSVDELVKVLRQPKKGKRA